MDHAAFLTRIADEVEGAQFNRATPWTTMALARMLTARCKEWSDDYPTASSLAAKISRAIAACKYTHPRWDITRAEYKFEPHLLWLQ